MALDDEEDSNAGSSENDNDEDMEDADNGREDDAQPENEDEQEAEYNEEEDDGDDGCDAIDDSPTHARARRSSPSARNMAIRFQVDGATHDSRLYNREHNGESLQLSPVARMTPGPGTAPAPFNPMVRAEALTAVVYDIVPTIAAPHSTSINALTATPDMRWVFSGGSDGWVRKFNWVDTVNSKSMLTVAQRHPFVDSVTKAGVLMSYWENDESSGKGSEEALSLSPVYSLAVHREALWLLSGTETGAINLQSVRHQEGKRITTLNKHTSAVSVLSLAHDERSVLSGSWDKNIHDWDLNTGQIKRSFVGSLGQISAIEIRPESNVPIPHQEPLQPTTNGTHSSNNTDKERGPHALVDVVDPTSQADDSVPNIASPTDSLFGGNGDADSLFGDNDGSGEVTDVNFGNDDDDDDFSKALATDLQQQKNNNDGLDFDRDETMTEQLPTDTIDADMPLSNGFGDHSTLPQVPSTLPHIPSTLPQVPSRRSAEPRLPHLDECHIPALASTEYNVVDNNDSMHEHTFLDAAIDGTLHVWDRRQANAIARIIPSRGVPPWCMHACWSPDGNFIYAGRRNGTVDEYSVHKGLREPRRSLKFPGGSGAITAVRAMPNARHIVCASYDILRLYNLKDEESSKPSTVPFLIVPGHRTGVVSQLYMDPTCTYMISTGGNRGWEGNTTEVLLGYDINSLAR